jgi:ABC-type lipopolysaccharide export system ATPase subunit
MYGGKVLIQGDKETIINNEQVKKVYLGNNF